MSLTSCFEFLLRVMSCVILLSGFSGMFSERAFGQMCVAAHVQLSSCSAEQLLCLMERLIKIFVCVCERCSGPFFFEALISNSDGKTTRCLQSSRAIKCKDLPTWVQETMRSRPSTTAAPAKSSRPTESPRSADGGPRRFGPTKMLAPARDSRTWAQNVPNTYSSRTCPAESIRQRGIDRMWARSLEDSRPDLLD